MRITIACPHDMIDDANQIAMVLGLGPDDGRSFREAAWADTNGNRYACTSFEASPAWLEAAAAPLVRPDWDLGPAYAINLAGAKRAQAALEIWAATDDSIPPPRATPGRMTVIVGLPSQRAIAAMMHGDQRAR